MASDIDKCCNLIEFSAGIKMMLLVSSIYAYVATIVMTSIINLQLALIAVIPIPL